jgi:hypothetical protein
VREFGGFGPAHHGRLTDFFGLTQAASLKIAQHEASICFFAVWRNPPGLLELIRGLVEISSIKSVLALAEEHG